MTWQTIERPGYFGGHRDERYAQFNEAFGFGGWRLVWQMGQRTADIAEAVMVYEDAYFEHLCSRPDLLELLAAEAADVYDDSASNVESQLEYGKQESGRTHLQDIAIRRCLVRSGHVFRGTQLVQIRDAGATPPVHSLSFALSPGKVPFHIPAWIIKPELEGWWEKGTVESWYQSNKLLQVYG